MKKISKMVIIALIVLVAMLPVTANGQGEGRAFPNRQIQNIFPWSAGVAYAVSQVVADQMGQELSETVIVTSTTGASGVKAAMTTLSKPADGYTIFDGYVAPLILSPLFGKADYTYDDFEPLYAVASNAFAVASRPDETRWNDLPGMLAYAKSHPGELRYSSGADISLPHMIAAAMLKKADGVCRNIPYNDTGESWKEFLSGEIDFMIINSGQYKAHKDEMNVLAVLSDRPMPEDGIPGPLAMEFGVDIGLQGLAATGWTWWVVHKDTPEDALTILRGAMKAALDNPDVQEKIRKLGFAPLPSEEYSPEDYGEQCGSINNQLKAALDAIEWEKAELAKL